MRLFTSNIASENVGLQKLSVAVPVTSSVPASYFDTELFIIDSEALPDVENSKSASNTVKVNRQGVINYAVKYIPFLPPIEEDLHPEFMLPFLLLSFL
jgi:hypothetical protein